MMGAISTHVLDVSRGRPAAGVAVRLDKVWRGGYVGGGVGRTDDDGRLRTLTGDVALEAGTYRLTFEVGEYFSASRVDTFYPSVQVTFEVRDAGQHYHVPLLVSPYGYSTYRGR
jgi:5-hydroxyisourate hydrolase